MRIHNVHERVLDVSLDAAAPLLDRIGGPTDLIFPTPAWDPIVLDGPLAIGTKGRHGPIRYHVSAYEPGRRVEFSTDPAIGIVGTHTFELESLDERRTILRHTVAGSLEGAMNLTWPFAIHWLHNAILEDLLDRAEQATGGRPQPRSWSPWVRLLYGFTGPRATTTTPPETELLKNALDRVDYIDAYAIRCRRGMPTEPRQWADALFHDVPPWVLAAMSLRQAVVGLVGIERENLDDAFRTHGQTDDEVLLGTDAGHLDFRVSVLREPDRVVVTTVVKLNDERGHLYWQPVKRIHPTVVRSMLDRTAGKLAQTTNGLAVGGIGAGSAVSPRR